MDMNYDPLFPLADPQERVPERMTNRSCPQISITDRNLGMDESAEMPEESMEQPVERPLGDSIDPALLALAMGFVPRQSWEQPYDPDVALARGTIFPGLDKPFLGEPPIAPQPRMRREG